MSNAPHSEQVTRILGEIARGDETAASRLFPLVYDELKALAGRYFGSQPAQHTLQPTALVHEAFLKLASAKDLAWKDRAHFLAICATAMRNLLTDHARRKQADKRGGGWRRVTLADVEGRSQSDDVDVLDLDEALTRLEALNERQARIVEYRFFSGMSLPEIAHRLAVSESTVENDWRMARAWLCVQLEGSA